MADSKPQKRSALGDWLARKLTPGPIKKIDDTLAPPRRRGKSPSKGRR